MVYFFFFVKSIFVIYLVTPNIMKIFRWWPTMTFKIEQNNIQKARFYIYTFGKLVTEARIVLNSLSIECMEEFIHLLQLLSENNNLKNLIIEPTHCRFEVPSKITGNR